MKLSLILSLLLSPLFATASVSASKAGAPQKSAAPTISRARIFESDAASRRFYISTNFVELAKSNGNLSLDLLANNKVALNFRVATSSAKEDLTKQNIKSKYIVDRTHYGLGASVFLFGAEAEKNLILSPALLFGTQKENSVDSRQRDLSDIQTQSGLGVKAAGLLRLTKDITAEVGLSANNLSGEFKGDVLAGIGYLF